MVDINFARRTVERFTGLIREQCERLEVAGSIRRGKAEVKDGEIVVIPKAGLWPLVDELLKRGEIAKAEYGDTKTNRWGAKYRGLVYLGVKVELFTADADNWGYQYWLRTGPGTANTFVMTWLKQKGQPIQAKDGYWWWNGKRLRTPDEETVFEMLGMHYIPPSIRGEEIYRQETIWNKAHTFPDFARYVIHEPEPERPQQLSMLDLMFAKEEREKPGEKALRIAAERAYNDRVLYLYRTDKAAWWKWLSEVQGRVIPHAPQDMEKAA